MKKRWKNEQLLRCKRDKQADSLKISSHTVEQTNEKIVRLLKNVWRSTQTKTEVATQFNTDTNLEIATIQDLFILSYALWEAGQLDASREKFGALSTSMGSCACTNLSPTSKTFFNDMFQLMPQTMQQDAQVIEMVRMMKEKINP